MGLAFVVGSSRARANPRREFALRRHGSLLLEDTEFGEELSELGSVATDCLDDKVEPKLAGARVLGAPSWLGYS